MSQISFDTCERTEGDKDDLVLNIKSRSGEFQIGARRVWARGHDLYIKTAALKSYSSRSIKDPWETFVEQRLIESHITPLVITLVMGTRVFEFQRCLAVKSEVCADEHNESLRTLTLHLKTGGFSIIPADKSSAELIHFQV